MFCPECGTQIKDDSKFCIKCGHRIEGEIKGEIKKETQGQKGKDIHQEVLITDEEVLDGVERKVSVRKENKEIDEITIKIPPGIPSGEVLKISGKGESGLNGGTNGDLYIKIVHCKEKIKEDLNTTPKTDNTSKDNIKSETGQKYKVITCSDCGKVIEEGSTFCPHCKVSLTQTIQGNYKVYNSYRCPECGSDRVTQVGMFNQKRKTGGIGCLLWIIIFLLCPLLFIIFGGFGYFILEEVAEMGWFGIFIFGVIFFITYRYIILNSKKSNMYVCERCGSKFRREDEEKKL